MKYKIFFTLILTAVYALLYLIFIEVSYKALVNILAMGVIGGIVSLFLIKNEWNYLKLALFAFMHGVLYFCIQKF